MGKIIEFDGSRNREDEIYVKENSFIDTFCDSINSNDMDKDDILNALMDVNGLACTLNPCTENPMSGVSDEIIEFTTWFMETYGECCELMDELDNAYKNDEPLSYIFDLSDFIMQQRYIIAMDKVIENADALKRINMSVLYDYITKIKSMCVLTFGMDNYSEVVLFPEPKDRDDFIIGMLKACITHSITSKLGSLIIRKLPKEKKEIVSGFRFENGDIECLCIEKIKWAVETQPDGSRVVNENEIFEQAVL